MNIWILEVGNTRAKWAAFRDNDGSTAEPFSVEAMDLPTDPAQAMAIWSAKTESEDVICITGSGDLDPWLQAAPHAKVLCPGDELPLDTAAVPSTSLGLDRAANARALRRFADDHAIFHAEVGSGPAVDQAPAGALGSRKITGQFVVIRSPVPAGGI